MGVASPAFVSDVNLVIVGGSLAGLSAGCMSGRHVIEILSSHLRRPFVHDASARVPVTGFLASIVKGTVVLALVRILSTVPLDPVFASAIGLLGILSIYFGNITAIRQQGFRRLLAYSSIAHAGYMLFAFVDRTGARAEDLLWYVAIYAATVIIAAAAFTVLCPGESDDTRLLDGTFQAQPAASLTFGLAMLSLAGIPPLPGFFAKLFIFKSVIASGHLVFAVIAFIGSFIGVTYYLTLFFRLFATEALVDDSPPSG